jgi:hypothetical protein
MTVWAAPWAAILAALLIAAGAVVWGGSTAGRACGLGDAGAAFAPALALVPALLREGFSAVAASTAAVTVFTACRAPKPSARPKRTTSMLEV